MSETIYKGTISFIHHDKQYASIDYTANGKKKSITGRIDEATTGKSKGKHVFRIGDEINFQTRLSERGDKMVACNLKFLYNTALEKLISKAHIENRFAGYFKVVDGETYVKERDSYIFFPLKLSKWEKPPAESALNETITFKLINIDKPNIAAELFSHSFIPEYRKAEEHFKNKKEVEASVSRVSPFAVYLQLFDDKIQAKLERTENDQNEYKAGDILKVSITYLSPSRIVVTKNGLKSPGIKN